LQFALVKHFQVLFGIALSVVCGYLVVRGVEWAAVWTAFRQINPFAFVPALACVGLFFLLRAYRWQRFVAPLQPLPLRPFFSATLIGFMANDVLPLRVGELVRAYALAHLTPVRISTALATAVLERVWDAIAVSVLLVATLSRFPLPAWLARTNLLILGGCAVVLVGGWVLVHRGEALFSWLPPRLAGLAERFVMGFTALRSLPLIVLVSLLSLATWLTLVVYYWILLRACGFTLPVEAALVVTVVTAFAVALPAAPGYVGTFQYATVLALSFFPISKEEALSFSIIAHVAQLVPVIVAGLIALVQARLPLWPSRLVQPGAEEPDLQEAEEADETRTTQSEPRKHQSG
jgi:hypothetical protein